MGILGVSALVVGSVFFGGKPIDADGMNRINGQGRCKTASGLRQQVLCGSWRVAGCDDVCDDEKEKKKPVDVGGGEKRQRRKKARVAMQRNCRNCSGGRNYRDASRVGFVKVVKDN